MEEWQALGLNLAVVALFISVWVNLSGVLAQKRQALRSLVFGALMGGAAVATMMNAVPFAPGILIDLRGAVLCLSGLFGGPVAVVVTLAFAVTYRLIIGGAGTPIGIATLALSAALGLGGWMMTRRSHSLRQIAFMALAITAMVLGFAFFLPSPSDGRPALAIALPPAFLTGLVTLATGLALIQIQRGAEDRMTLRAALFQSPDYFYVKNAKREFVAVNQAVASFLGHAGPEQLVGQKGGDVATSLSEPALGLEEEGILTTGKSILDMETTRRVGGETHVFSTSKVPLRDPAGDIIGLAVSSRDVTERRRLEEELRTSRDLLVKVTSEMSDGLSMFDADGTMIFCNRLGQTLFPLTSDVRRVGVNLREILQAVIRTGEQSNLPDDVEGWIEDVMRGLHSATEQELQLADGRWLHLRNRPTEGGATIVVVSEITSLKSKEAELVSLASQLRTLAATDSLTGLINRRSFDAALISLFESSVAAHQPISVLMVDVDNFKLFNDLYGHLKGDDCLKAIASCLQETVRGTDTVGRFGGEEFVALLPGASAEQAGQIADRLRSGLAACAIPHAASPTNLVTVSVGIACTIADAPVPHSGLLLARADEALYAAKRSGKDQAIVWRPGIGQSFAAA